MANPTRTRSALIGVLAALSIIAAVGISTVIVHLSNADAAPQPPLPPTSAPAPEPTTEQAPPTVTETVTVDPPAPTPQQPTVTVTELPVDTPPPAPRSTPAPTPAPAPVNSDATIRTETSEAFGVVNTYWTELFNSWKDPQGNPISWWVPDLMGGTGFYDSAQGNPYSCSGESLPDNAEFCEYRNANGYYLGTGDVAWDMELFRDAGNDGAIYATVAHEVAHAAQARFWFDGELATPNPYSTDLAGQIAMEQQADCIAGATLAKAEQDGYLTIEPGDLEEISTFFLSMESGGDHGDAADRLAEFRWGYGGDIESCLYNQGVPPH